MSETNEPTAVRCVECGREAGEEAAEREGWRFFSDGAGELLPFCPGCAEREFGTLKPACDPPACDPEASHLTPWLGGA